MLNDKTHTIAETIKEVIIYTLPVELSMSTVDPKVAQRWSKIPKDR